MTLRLLIAGGHRVVSGWAIGASAMFGTAAALYTLLFAPVAELTTIGAGLWTTAIVGLVVAAAHPSAVRLSEPSRRLGRARVVSRAALPGVALMIPPAIAVWQDLQGHSILITAIAGLVIGAVVIARYVGLVVSRERVHRELHRRAWYDDLTGLSNRARFYARLESMLADASTAKLALLYLDLDGFKAMNDRHGHAAGDELLRTTAARISAALRGPDLAARLAGDEFVVLLPDADAERARMVAQRLELAVAAPIRVGGQEVAVGVSIGLAVSDGPEDVDALVARADRDMYRVKNAQRLARARAALGDERDAPWVGDQVS